MKPIIKKLLDYKQSNPTHKTINDINLLTEIKAISGDIPWKQKAAMLLLDIDKAPVCYCGNDLQFTSKDKSYYSTEYGGWRQFCSRKCMQSCKNIVEKRRKTNLDRYGVESYAKTDEFKKISSAKWSEEKKEKFNAKYKQNAINKYGVDHYSKTDEYLEKRTATTQEKYGVDNVFQSPEKKEKIKETSINKNGYYGWFSSDEGKDYYKTNNPMYDEEIKTKAKITWLINNYSHVDKEFIAASRSNSCEVFQNYVHSLAELGYKTRNSMASYVKISPSKFSAWMRHYGMRDQYVVKSGTSEAENQVYEFVKGFFADTINNDRLILTGKELDVYVPSKQFAIEMNGVWSHSESQGKYPKYHVEKTNNCESLGIRLLHIFEDEWKDPIKNSIWKSIIKNKLGLTENKIFARKCNIQIITANQARNFLNLNHLAGFRPAKTHFALIYQDEIVSVMSIGNSIYQKNTTEVIRFASKIDTVVIGGLSKLLSKVNDTNLVCYADRRISSTLDSSYLSFFNTVEITPPSWYGFDQHDYCRQHRLSFTKQRMIDILGDKYDYSISVYDNMLANKYDRIWDSGNIKLSQK